MNRAHVPAKRRLPSNRIVSDETDNSDTVPVNNSTTTSTISSNGSKPVPSPKPKPRHHKDFARINNDLHATDNNLHVTTSDRDLHTTTSNLHATTYTKTTGDLHTRNYGDLHTRNTGDLHTKVVTVTKATTMGWSTPDSNATTRTDTITTTIVNTTSGQAKMRTSEVHVRPVTTTSEVQAAGSTGIVQAYRINTDDPNATSVKAKPHVEVANNPPTKSNSSLNVSSKTISDLPLMTDLHTKIDTDDNFHTKTTDRTTATKHMLDVVSDHVVEEADIGWSPTHSRGTTNDEVANEQRKRLKGI